MCVSVSLSVSWRGVETNICSVCVCRLFSVSIWEWCVSVCDLRQRGGGGGGGGEEG